MVVVSVVVALLAPGFAADTTGLVRDAVDLASCLDELRIGVAAEHFAVLRPAHLRETRVAAHFRADPPSSFAVVSVPVRTGDPPSHGNSETKHQSRPTRSTATTYQGANGWLVARMTFS